MSILRDFAVSWIGKCLFSRTIAHIHGCKWISEWKKGGWRGHILISTLKRCDQIILLGNTFTREMKEETKLPCVSIDNGVTHPVFKSSRSISPPGLPIQLLFLSNLMGTKGLWIAAEVLRGLLRKNVRAKLICAGEWHNGKERDAFLSHFSDELRFKDIELIGFAGDQKKKAII
jgi:glycosyltransferase involved in cell wall biosynthesis